MITRRRVKPEGEYLLLGNMIMNNDVLAASYNRYKSKELKANHFTPGYRPIFRWLIQYYSKHRKAPKRTIQKIFEVRGKSLGETNKELVEEYLDRLASEYSEYEEEITDPEYIRAEVLPDFIRERELTARLQKAQDDLESGKIQEAEKTVTSYAKVEEEETDKNIGTIIPFSEEDVKRNFTAALGETVYTFNGDLNHLIGPLCKSWLVAITGVEKSGKSFVAQEIAYQAALYQKKRVLIINLELNQALARNRLWRRISRTTDRMNIGRAVYPVLDCENNQFRTCKLLKKFPNKKPLFDDPKGAAIWRKNRDWTPCNKCRGEKRSRNAARTKRFIPKVWFEQSEKKIREISEIRVSRALKRKRFNNLKNLRIKCFPRDSVTFDEAADYILRYIDKAKWHPHMIIFDYLDILASEHENPRIDADRKWKKGSKLAGELDCLLITPDQANKPGRTAYMLDQTSTSESKTKDGHLDVRIAINQRNIDKAIAIARWNVIFHRHIGFNVEREVITTQRLQTAEPLLDNAFLLGGLYNIPVGIDKL